MNGKGFLVAGVTALMVACVIGGLMRLQAAETVEVDEDTVGDCAIDPPARGYEESADWYEETSDEAVESTGDDGDHEDEEPIVVSESDAKLIAQILYYEIGGGTKLEQSAVAWVILNRVDSEYAYFPDTVEAVCKQSIKSNGKEVFMFAYRSDAPVREDLYEMAVDVLTRWYREKRGETNVGRTLPAEYVYFWGNGRENFFRIEYQGNNYWDWSLPNPYDEP